MSEEEVIKRVKVDASGAVQGLTQYTGGLNDVTQATQVAAEASGKVSAAAKDTLQSLDELRSKLDEVKKAEDAFVQSVVGGTQASEDEERASTARRAEITRLEAALVAASTAEAKVTESVQARAVAMAAADTPAKAQVQTLADRRAQLQALVAQETAFQQTLIEGKHVTDEQIDAAGERQDKIRALTRELGQQQAAERAAAQMVSKHADSILDATKAEAKREQTIEEMRRELIELTKAEMAANDRLRAGQASSAEARGEAAKRQARIEDLTDRLARQRAAEERANAAVADSTRRLKDQTGILSDAKGEILDMVKSWGSYAAIAGAVVTTINAISDAAQKSNEALVALGKSTRSLATNIGGKRADQVVGQITDVAIQEQLSPEARNQLIEFAAGFSDLNPTANNDQIMNSVRRAARFSRATGVGGDQAMRLIDTMQKRLGIGEDQAYSAATTMLTGGFSADNLNSVLQKVGGRGGMEFLAMLSAARSEGLDPEAVSKSIPGMLESLTRTENGRVAKPLARAGVTQDMDVLQRMETLFSALDSGRISRAQFEEAFGGAASVQVAEPIRRAMAGGKVDQARQALVDPAAMDAAIVRQDESASVTAANRAQQNQMRTRAASERSSLSGAWQAWEAITTNLAEQGGGSAKWGALTAGLGADRVVQMTINNITNINPITNASDPLHSDSGRRNQGRD